MGMSSQYCGGFQTVVMAANMDQAWEVATDTDEWELLDFEVSKVMIFPKDPTQL
jgi:hypothetical protein